MNLANYQHARGCTEYPRPEISGGLNMQLGALSCGRRFFAFVWRYSLTERPRFGFHQVATLVK